MEKHLITCARCGADVSRDTSAGLTYCSGCGRGLEPSTEHLDEIAPPSMDADDLADRRRWRISFWLIFLLTPVAMLLTGFGSASAGEWLPAFIAGTKGAAAMRDFAVFGVLGMLVLGALGSGYCLQRLKRTAQTNGEAIAQIVGFAIGILFLYVVIAFSGCLLALPFTR